MHKFHRYYSWPHFDARRTKDGHGDLGVLLENIISLTVSAGSNDFDALMQIGSSSEKSIPIKSLTDRLKGEEYIRGRVFFGRPGDEIQKILDDYPLLRWWMEKDGLVVDEARTELGPLSDFDRVAGGLVREHWIEGKLSESSLILIAEKLDAEGLLLKENLQPAQWKPIADFNQKNSKSAIKTFAVAVKRPQFARSVRRRLYLARERYNKALRPAEPILIEF